jgi:outer membrane protein assembly factor BamE (lipoprotein component of BamABCDE complex)
MKRFSITSPAVLLFCLTMAACTPTLVVQGYVPDEETLATVQQGVDNKDAVVSKLGSPSSVAAFNDDTWIYISKQTENFAFFEPTVIGQDVVAINFDPEGRVEEVRRYTLEDGRLIDPVTRKTPTHGRELGILEQLFGNVGRFTAGTDG